MKIETPHPGNLGCGAVFRYRLNGKLKFGHKDLATDTWVAGLGPWSKLTTRFPDYIWIEVTGLVGKISNELTEDGIPVVSNPYAD